MSKPTHPIVACQRASDPAKCIAARAETRVAWQWCAESTAGERCCLTEHRAVLCAPPPATIPDSAPSHTPPAFPLTVCIALILGAIIHLARK